jgi:opacity protein-like surface antigen
MVRRVSLYASRFALTLMAACSIAPALHAQESEDNGAAESPTAEEGTTASDDEGADTEDDSGEKRKKRKKRKKDDDETADEDNEDFGHGGQFALRASLVAGFRIVMRYDDSPYCSEYDQQKSAADQVKFCGHTAPLAVDLGLSFAPLDFVEPYIWARFGLAGEAETDTKALLILGAGARIYTMSDSAFKIYVEPAIGLELEEGQGHQPWASSGEYKQDVVFHVAAGPQLDLAQNFGLFVDGGLTMGILRTINSSLELKAGVQARFP